MQLKGSNSEHISDTSHDIPIQKLIQGLSPLSPLLEADCGNILKRARLIFYFASKEKTCTSDDEAVVLLHALYCIVAVCKYNCSCYCSSQLQLGSCYKAELNIESTMEAE